MAKFQLCLIWIRNLYSHSIISLTLKTEDILSQQIDQTHPVDCVQTKTGRLIATYNSKNDLEEIKGKLQQNTTLGRKIQITEEQKRKVKIIVFGAPEAIVFPSRGQNPLQELQNYQYDILKPAPVKQLKSKKSQYKLCKVLQSKKPD